MDRSRYQLLAGAAFAANQNCRIRGRDFRNEIVNLLHGSTLPDHAPFGPQFLHELMVTLLEQIHSRLIFNRQCFGNHGNSVARSDSWLGYIPGC